MIPTKKDWPSPVDTPTPPKGPLKTFEELTLLEKVLFVTSIVATLGLASYVVGHGWIWNRRKQQ